MLADGAVFEVWIGGEWQAVTLHSGGYHGYYYETVSGERGRLALCMRVRWCETASRDEEKEAASSLERVRLEWLGKRVQNKIPVAAGYVCGQVRAITARGKVIFVYTSPLNSVSVRAVFAVERIGEVLELAA